MPEEIDEVTRVAFDADVDSPWHIRGQLTFRVCQHSPKMPGLFPGGFGCRAAPNDNAGLINGVGVFGSIGSRSPFGGHAVIGFVWKLR